MKYGIYANAKATHIFFSKNTCELDIVLTRTVNILTTNDALSNWAQINTFAYCFPKVYVVHTH